MNLKKIGKVFTSKFVGTGPSSYEKRIYRVAVSQRLRNTAIKYLIVHSNLACGHLMVSPDAWIFLLPFSRPSCNTRLQTRLAAVERHVVLIIFPVTIISVSLSNKIDCMLITNHYPWLKINKYSQTTI